MLSMENITLFKRNTEAAGPPQKAFVNHFNLVAWCDVLFIGSTTLFLDGLSQTKIFIFYQLFWEIRSGKVLRALFVFIHDAN